MSSIVNSGIPSPPRILRHEETQRFNEKLMADLVDQFKQEHECFYQRRHSAVNDQHRLFGGRLVVVELGRRRISAYLNNPYDHRGNSLVDAQSLSFHVILRHLQLVFTGFIRQHFMQNPVVMQLRQIKPAYDRETESLLVLTHLHLRALRVLSELYSQSSEDWESRYHHTITNKILSPAMTDAISHISNIPYDLRAYNHLVRNPGAIELHQENPALLPVWYRFSETGNIGQLCKQYRSNAGALKTLLFEKYQVSRKAWRKLHTMPLEFNKALSEMPVDEIGFYLARFSRLSCWPSLPVLTELRDNGFFYNFLTLYHPDLPSSASKQLDKLLKIFLVEAEKRHPDLRVFIVHWIRPFIKKCRTEQPVFDKNQLATGFRLIERYVLADPEQLADLHAKQASTLAPVHGEWESELSAFEHHGYQVIPLVTRASLEEEALMMSHCVNRYAAPCQDGTSRIFSIRRANQRLATLELRKPRQSRQWHFEEIQGPHNHAVPAELQNIARLVEILMNRRVQSTEL